MTGRRFPKASYASCAVPSYNTVMNIEPTDFLTEVELSRGPDVLRPGTATGHLGDGKIAFIFAAFPDDAGQRLFTIPASVGHEQMITRPEILKAMFGPRLAEVEQ